MEYSSLRFPGGKHEYQIKKSEYTEEHWHGSTFYERWRIETIEGFIFTFSCFEWNRKEYLK